MVDDSRRDWFVQRMKDEWETRLDSCKHPRSSHDGLWREMQDLLEDIQQSVSFSEWHANRCSEMIQKFQDQNN